MASAFLEITVIICLAALLSILFRLLRQPEILAYILTGILVGPLGLFHLHNQEIVAAMAEVGITLLLFMVGLEIKIKDLTSVGKMSALVGGAQIIFSFIIAYLISLVSGYSVLTSFYIGLAMTFSSTIIIVKLLSDKREMHSLYGKMSLGILLIQDFLAILFLIILAGLNQPSSTPFMQFGLIALKVILLFGAVIYLSIHVFPRVVEFLARSQEVLFLSSVAWVFGLAALVTSPYIGFSIEIGGFLAGLALANSVANYQIIAKVKILRDFFIVTFFVLLGMNMKIGNISEIIIPAIALLFFVLFIKPLIVMMVMGDAGYRKRTSFLTGLTLSQISEFSLIVAYLGNKMGHVPDSAVSLITVVGIVTFVSSSYFIGNSKWIFNKIGKKLNFLENKKDHVEELEHPEIFEKLSHHVVLVGGDQMGLSILEALENLDMDVVVIDFDPNVVKRLKDRKVHRLFGDIADLDIQERAKLDSAKLVISTIPDLEDNLLLLKELHHENRRAKIIAVAMERHEAKSLYKAGADYVVLPYLAGGRQVADVLIEDLQKIELLKEKDKQYLKGL